MFKILFADDEPRMLRALQNIINWEEICIEIVGCAEDGTEALKLIREKKPDIVITDICMPGINGLELSEACADNRYKPEFIILTGYSEFEYVRRAMKSGAVRYLLKPLDTDELRETIMETCEKLSEKYEKMREIDEAVRYVKQDTFVRICFGSSDEQLFNRAALLLQSTVDAPVYMMLFRMVSMPYGELEKIKLQLEEDVLPENVCVFTVGTRTLAVVSAAEDQSVDQATVRAMKKYYTGVYKAKVKGLPALANAYHTAVASFTQLKEGITIIENHVSVLNNVTEKNTKQVMELIIHDKKDEAVYKVREDIKRMAWAREEYSSEYAISLLMQMNGYCEPDGINIENLFENTLFALDNTYDYDTLAYLCEECIEEFVKATSKTKKMNTAVLMHDIINYISQNYTRPMTQQDIAKSLNITPGMVSRLIKKSTGMKYNDYVNDLRIRKAKQLLSSTDIQISQLVYAVGYTDYYYFISRFKGITGMSPTEYRRKKGKAGDGDE